MVFPPPVLSRYSLPPFINSYSLLISPIRKHTGILLMKKRNEMKNKTNEHPEIYGKVLQSGGKRKNAKCLDNNYETKKFQNYHGSFCVDYLLLDRSPDLKNGLYTWYILNIILFWNYIHHLIYHLSCQKHTIYLATLFFKVQYTGINYTYIKMKSYLVFNVSDLYQLSKKFKILLPQAHVQKLSYFML